MTKKKATKKAAAKQPAETPEGTETQTAEAPVETKPSGRKATKEKAPKEELVVFAFRLRPEERDLIHRAAGAAKASRFVRALSVAASRGDEKAVSDIVGAVKTQLAQ
jgi:hypothetical protein